VPPAVRSAAIILGPLERDRRASSPSGLIDDSGLNAEQVIDEPVTSGGDSLAGPGSPDVRDKDDKDKPK
jgi:hypothetical protein